MHLTFERDGNEDRQAVTLTVHGGHVWLVINTMLKDGWKLTGSREIDHE